MHDRPAFHAERSMICVLCAISITVRVYAVCDVHVVLLSHICAVLATTVVLSFASLLHDCSSMLQKAQLYTIAFINMGPVHTKGSLQVAQG